MRRLKLLVVDDEPNVVGLLKDVLERAGHEVATAADGRQALALLASSALDSDLVITDLIMPNADGIELIQNMSQRYPSIPVVAISGGGYFGPTMYLKAAKALGASALLTKPFKNSELLEIVAKLTS